MKKKLLMAIFSVFLLAGAPRSEVVAATVEEQQIELQVRDIAKTLRCAVCQNESVWESRAPLAQQMRDIIRERLVRGESAKEIRAYFLSRYGDYILLSPRKSGLNWLLWAGPFVLLSVGGLFLTWTLSRWVAQAAATKQDAPLPIDDRLRKRIEDELRSRED